MRCFLHSPQVSWFRHEYLWVCAGTQTRARTAQQKGRVSALSWHVSFLRLRTSTHPKKNATKKYCFFPFVFILDALLSTPQLLVEAATPCSSLPPSQQISLFILYNPCSVRFTLSSSFTVLIKMISSPFYVYFLLRAVYVSFSALLSPLLLCSCVLSYCDRYFTYNSLGAWLPPAPANDQLLKLGRQALLGG